MPWGKERCGMAREVIAQVRGDLTGDGIPEIVRLTGTRLEDSAAFTEIALEIQQGESCRVHCFALPENTGYSPRLILAPITAAGKQDVITSIDSGGSGGIGYYAVFSYINHTYRMIFDSEAYAAESPAQVEYADYYAAWVTAGEKAYPLSLLGKGKDYLAGLYDASGMLRAPQMGFVSPVGLLYPADFNGDGRAELAIYRQVSGLYRADGLGELISVLQWKDAAFTLYWQTVGVNAAETGPAEARKE